MDCLLLHVPKFSNVYAPLGEFMNITYMPMGMPALSNWLNRHGWQTEMIHLGVEWIVDPEHAAVAEICDMDVPMIGMPLYWHYQTFDVLDVAERIKARRPDVFLFLGGVTAGYYAKEILRGYPFVDAIIVGDGELAAVELAEAVHGRRELADVANLVHRDSEGGIVTNKRKIASDQVLMDALDFGDLSTLRHHEVYISSFGFPFAYPKQFSQERNDTTQKLGRRSFFPLFTGRGCAWECTFCGGNRNTLRELMGTAKLRFRDYKRVVDDVEIAVEQGYQTMALCFDPVPQHDDYYVEMFREIRRRKLAVDYYFECWGLPTRRFLREWVETFGLGNEDSYLALSPDAGNEEVRRRNKQPFYTDAQFFESMDDLQEFGITADIFFTIALPYETVETALDSQRMARRIRNEYTVQKRVMTWERPTRAGQPAIRPAGIVQHGNRPPQRPGLLQRPRRCRRRHLLRARLQDPRLLRRRTRSRLDQGFRGLHPVPEVHGILLPGRRPHEALGSGRRPPLVPFATAGDRRHGGARPRSARDLREVHLRTRHQGPGRRVSFDAAPLCLSPHAPRRCWSTTRCARASRCPASPSMPTCATASSATWPPPGSTWWTSACPPARSSGSKSRP